MRSQCLHSSLPAENAESRVLINSEVIGVHTCA